MTDALAPTFGKARAPTPATGTRLITPKDLPSKGIHYHMSHLRRMWSDGRFPKPRNLSPRRIAWSEAEIDAWIAKKLAGGRK